MEIDDNAELKQYFIDSGWTPSDDYWNVQKGADGKPVRDANNKFIKTTPKINHAGKLCPNLLKLDGDVPKKVVKFLSYRNRLGVITGWLNNWRLEFDGRLSAEISGYAPTSRVKHKLVVNVPKAADDVLLGHEMRELFCVDKGNWYIGTDASALENRTLSSYTFKYDNGEFARRQIEFDPHQFNAFAFFPHLSNKFDANNPDTKELPDFKPWRNKAKTGAYLLAFGGGAPKLASSLGLSKSDGQAAFNNYWEKNKGLGLLKKAVEGYYDTTGKKKYIPAIDGRIVSVRGKNVLLSCLGQGCGAISMSYAACLMDNWLGDFYLDELGRPYYLYENKKVKRVSFFHDEYSWEVEDGVQDEIRELSVKGIVKAGEVLKLALPLAAEGKMAFEGTWQNVH
jgi:DNA polymerase I-like protein with 3'-5' exonuclease and polymerase domains